MDQPLNLLEVGPTQPQMTLDQIRELRYRAFSAPAMITYLEDVIDEEGETRARSLEPEALRRIADAMEILTEMDHGWDIDTEQFETFLTDELHTLSNRIHNMRSFINRFDHPDPKVPRPYWATTPEYRARMVSDLNTYSKDYRLIRWWLEKCFAHVSKFHPYRGQFCSAAVELSKNSLKEASDEAGSK